MERLTFAPSANEFFLWFEGEAEPPADDLGASARLRRAGWPTAARILRGGQRSLQAEGFLIELIDALPILAGAGIEGGWPAHGPSVLGWAEACRAGLEEIARGRVVPRLRGVPLGGGDPRIGHIEAGWAMSMTLPRERRGLARLARGIGPSEIALPSGRLGSAQQMLSAHSAEGILSRMLDACADTLIREACWRGAVVRLRDMPASAWEQQLVRALTDMHPALSLPPEEASTLLREINAWADDEAEEPPLLPSPPSWRAAESLGDVLQRMLAPAAQLARHLLLMQPAPRTLLGALAFGAEDRPSLSTYPHHPGTGAEDAGGGE